MNENKLKSSIRAAKAIPFMVLSLMTLIAGISALGSEMVSPADREAATLCVDCHDDYTESLAHTAHSLTQSNNPQGLDCASCHSGAAEHVEDPSVENIGNPVNLPVGEQNNLCASCHRPHSTAGSVGMDVHLEQGFGCNECHSVHQGQDNLLNLEVENLCQKCHQGVLLQFQSRSNHPVNDGIVSCVSCHDFTGKSEPNFGHGPSANCASCHPEQSGPHMYEHPVAVSFATEGSNCTECHSPHGSPHEKLLKTPTSVLCQQCHGTPPLHRTKHSGLGAKFECADCHSQTHGSNDNRLMLDPDLGVKLFPNCYQSGCHDLEN